MSDGIRRQVPSPSRDAVCRSCGASISLLQIANGRVCDRLECRGPILREQQNAAHVERDRQRRAQANEALKLIDQVDVKSDRVAVVPSVDSPLISMSQQRLDRLRESIQSSIGKVVARFSPGQDRPSTSPVAASPVTASPDCESASRHLINACATCRGGCCRNGGDHAYVDDEVIEQFWMSDPGLTAEEIAETYVSKVPERSVSGSCIYHAVDGCRLPRAMRGSTCNDFICEGLRDRLGNWEKQDDETIAVAVDDSGRTRRISMSLRDDRRLELLDEYYSVE